MAKGLPTGWGAPPQSTHSVHNLDTFPMHFYRLEFKRVDGNDIIKKVLPFTLIEIESWLREISRTSLASLKASAQKPSSLFHRANRLRGAWRPTNSSERGIKAAISEVYDTVHSTSAAYRLFPKHCYFVHRCVRPSCDSSYTGIHMDRHTRFKACHDGDRGRDILRERSPAKRAQSNLVISG